MEKKNFDPAVLAHKPFRGILSEIAREEKKDRSTIWAKVKRGSCKETMTKVANKMQERIEIENELSKLSSYGE